MFRLTKLFALSAFIAIVAIGCQNQLPIAPESNDFGSLTPRFTLPTGATFDSASMFIYVNVPNGQTVNVHRVTADWNEASITWNNFGGAYDGAIWSSFIPAVGGWHSVNISTLVQGWLNGSFANYGLLLDQVDQNYPRAVYLSRESVMKPYLKIFYTTPGGPASDTTIAIADAYIWQTQPNTNFAGNYLYTGWAEPTDLEKQSLIKFDIEVTPRLAALGDFVWHDADMDGIQDASEAGFPGVAVHLYDCAGNLVASTTTDVNGYYLFDNLVPGNYNVHFVAPAGFIFAPNDQGDDDALDSDADVNTGMTICTTLEAGEVDLTWDAGLYRTPQLGCTRTIGYWKNHAGLGRGNQANMVTPLLPIWLGTAGGAKSLNVTTNVIAVNILNQNVYGTPSNGITKLYAQLLGAKLNIAAGASMTDVATIIASADAFLATHNHLDWSSLSPSEQQMVLGWHSSLDNYNNGLIGPGHCDD